MSGATEAPPTSSSETVEPAPPPVRRLLSGARRRPLRAWAAVVLLGYLLLVVAGVTTSSLGISLLRDDVAVEPPGLVAGQPRAIRSDEFLRTTPWRLGLMEAGSDDFASPLSFPDAALTATDVTGPVGAALFADSVLTTTVGRVAPVQVFAAIWWLPFVVVAALMPPLLARWGVRPHIGIPATGLALLAPASAWWSWGTLTPLAWAVGAALTATVGIDRWRRSGFSAMSAGLVLVSGLLLARLALSYQPWALPVGAAVLPTTLAALIRPSAGRRTALLLVAAVTGLGLALVLLFAWENSAALDVLSQTVYPGTRRSGGAALDLGLLLGAPALWVLQLDPATVASNASEISSGFTVLAVVAVTLAPAVLWRATGRGRAPAATSGIVLAGLALWCTVTWPQEAAQIPLLSLVPPTRVAEILGICAVIPFALVLQGWSEHRGGSRVAGAAVAATATLVVTGAAGSVLRAGYLPQLSPAGIWVTAVATAAVAAIAVLWSPRWWSLLPALVAAFVVVAAVNPIQVGFGDLQTGAAANHVREWGGSLPEGAHWATDDFVVDALLMANAQPALSGQQWVGPDVDTWAQLDPEGEFRESWNRGASYIVFAWTPGAELTVDNAISPDVIRVSVDPCDPRLTSLDLSLVVSNGLLDGSCLTAVGDIAWGGVTRHVYARSTAS